MYFDDEFLKSLPDDVPSAIIAICEKYFEAHSNISEPVALHTLAKEALGFFAAYSEVKSLGIDIPNFTGDRNLDDRKVAELFTEVKHEYSGETSQIEVERYKTMFLIKLGGRFHYEFSEGDLKLIQNLINELRELISITEELKEEHKQRLLRKLEKVQSELHKKVSDLDRFWGFCIDLSIVVGLMGKNAEPAADLVRKIVDIIWPAQTRAYELSSGLPFKLLGQPKDDKTKDDKS